MKTAKIFKNGQSEAVRLPKEFRFESDEVYVYQLGSAVILLPKQKGWSILEEGLAKFSSDFMTKRNQPKEQKRKKL